MFSEDMALCPADNRREIMSQKKANTVRYYLHVESKNAKLIETQPRMDVTRGWGLGQRAPNYSCKMKKFWDLMCGVVVTVNNTVL